MSEEKALLSHVVLPYIVKNGFLGVAITAASCRRPMDMKSRSQRVSVRAAIPTYRPSELEFYKR